MQKPSNRITALLALILALTLTTIAGYYYNWAWTGLPDYTPENPTEGFERGKTLWDWLNLLVIPLVLAIGGYLFRQAEKRTDEEIAERRRNQEQQIADDHRKQEQQIADDNLRETTLQTYLDRMSELLLAEDPNTSESNTKRQSLARARTLTTLRRLDPTRKGYLLIFLHESNLINNKTTLVNLSDADLTEIILRSANLSDANLSGAILRGAILHKTILHKATLSRAILSGANLRFANLSNADLSSAFLSDANLTRSILTGSILSGADLRFANLSDANLSRANLRGAILHKTILHKATLSGAILSGANLSDADLSDAFLSGADLSFAILSGATLSGAILNGAILSGAHYDNKTKWPKNFTPPADKINTDSQPNT